MAIPGAALTASRETAKSRVAGLVSRNAFEDGDARLAVEALIDVLAGQFAALVVVRPDERHRLHAGVGRRLHIEAGVDDDDRHLRVSGFHERRDDLARAARRDAERLDAGLNHVLDDLHLLLDVDLALGGLHLQRDAETIRGLLRAAAHVDEEGVVQRLEHERDGRLGGAVVAGVSRLHESESRDTAKTQRTMVTKTR